LPVFLLPDQIWTVKPKIIYTARNPKDAAISFYHHHRHLQGYRGTKEDYIQGFLNDKILYSPMNEHILEFWKLRNEPNVLFLFFEDMKHRLKEVVKITAKFLNKNYTQQQIDELCVHLHVDSMRKNTACNNDDLTILLKGMHDKIEDDYSFIRKGQVGAYKDELTQEEIAQLDNYMNHPDFAVNDFAYKF
jgi:hypothetical protein